MERLYKIKKGLDLNLKGAAGQSLRRVENAKTYAVAPSDFHGRLCERRVSSDANTKRRISQR